MRVFRQQSFAVFRDTHLLLRFPPSEGRPPKRRPRYFSTGSFAARSAVSFEQTGQISSGYMLLPLHVHYAEGLAAVRAVFPHEPPLEERDLAMFPENAEFKSSRSPKFFKMLSTTHLRQKLINPFKRDVNEPNEPSRALHIPQTENGPKIHV